jgi:serine/threonine-protein kinase
MSHRRASTTGVLASVSEGPATQLSEMWRQVPAPDLTAFLDQAGTLSAEQLAAVLYVDQRQRWLRGERPLAEDYLRLYSARHSEPEFALDLLFGEFRLRRLLGETPSLEEYQRRFPDLAEQLALQVKLTDAFASTGAGEPGSAGAAGAPIPALPAIPGYALVRELGRGGMGVVLLARQLRLNRAVALKMPPANLSAEEWFRFRTEAESAARLQHPHIVQVFETGEHEGRPFLVMELVEGGSLAQKLAAAPLEARRAAELLEKLARAIQYAHERGVIHRDLKPANILLQKDEGGRMKDEKSKEGSDSSFILHPLSFLPKITDFGLARRLYDQQSPDAVHPAARTQTGQVLGTPSYMAPEQAAGKGKDVGPAADVYALGAVLYECLTGRPPFRGTSPLETLLQVVRDDPVPPRKLQPGVPRDLETVCLKCLHKDPARRYASASDLALDLRRFQDGRPVMARPVGLLEQVVKWARRRPGAAAVLTAAVLLAALTIGGGLWLQGQATAQRQAQTLRQVKARHAMEDALEQAPKLWRQSRWDEAEKLLAMVQAEPLVSDANSDELRQRLQQAQDDQVLARKLEDVSLHATTERMGHVDLEPAARGYRKTLEEAGLSVDGDMGETAGRIRRSAIREQVVAALEDWALVSASDAPLRSRLLQLARRADPGSEWRDRLRNPELWADRSALRRLAGEAPLAELSPQALHLLGGLMHDQGLNAEPLLRAAVQRDPSNFWFNYRLGIHLYSRNSPGEGVGFLQTAAALRPLSVVLTDLGICLRDAGMHAESIVAYRRAIQQDGNNRLAFLFLGGALRRTGYPGEAIVAHRRAIEIAPRDFLGYVQLGYDLRVLGRSAEELEAFGKVVELNPKHSTARYEMGVVLQSLRRTDEAIVQLREATKLAPGLTMAWEALAESLIQSGQFAEARAATQRCLELPPGGEPRRKAQREQIALCDRMLALEARLPAVLAGESKAKDPADQCDLAELCSVHKRRYAAATRLYIAAFAAQPALADDLARNHRYNAACAAAQAGCGAGEDAGRLSETERTRLRRQAIKWLVADRDAWTKRLDSGNPPDQSLAARTLLLWQQDRDLACVRDEKPLRGLPEPERASWRELWASVEELLARSPTELLRRGRANARRREWSKAADCYNRAVKFKSSDDSDVCFEHAAVLLLSGDDKGYRLVCDAMIARFGKTPNLRGYHLARACTLAAGSVNDPARPGQLAAKELKASAHEHWSLTELAALHYRAGRFEQAVDRLNESLRAEGRPGTAVLAWLWLALAHQRLGEREEARRWLERAVKWLEPLDRGMPDRAEETLWLHLHNWMEAHVLRREAEKLLEAPGRKRS